MPKIRCATASDLPFLSRMLYEAANWSPDRTRTPIDVDEPELRRYLSDWGRRGDVAIIAIGDDEQPIGAAWYRFFGSEDRGYGFIDENIAEITIGVSPDARGRGVGTALMEALIDAARRNGVTALSLSVEKDNPAVRLYERHGFRKLHTLDGALTMRCDI